MSESLERLRRQAEWQRAQANLPWPEKIRRVEAARESIAMLRRSALAGRSDDTTATDRVAP